MIINNVKIALRYLFKNRVFSLINLCGLTLGFSCFIIIALYLHDELTFDMFHTDARHIYRVIQHQQQEDGSLRDLAPVAARIAPESTRQLPELEDATRIFVLGRITLGNDPANRDYEATLTTDPNFFNFFNFPLVEGDPNTVLQSPDAIVVSEKIARKYFGNESPVGKRLWSSLSRDHQPVELVVSGVMKDFPKNSHIQLDIVFSDKTWSSVFPWYNSFVSTDWSTNSFITYIKLKDAADRKAVERKMTALVKDNFPSDKEFKSNFTLQPLKEIHLYSDNIQGNDINANAIKPFYLYMFGAVGLLILIIACLNYMNLSTAAAFKRTKEIGTRKTLGAHKGQLIAHFVGEAVVLSAISLFLALAITQILVPSINDFTEKDLSLSTLPLRWIFGMMVIVIITGGLSSLYPAFIVSRIKPAEAMKKEVRLASRSLPVRKILVVAQFSISILMIASTLVIYRQLKFIQNKELGFDLENLLVVDINSNPLRRNFENVKSEFSKIAEVQAISASTRVPGEWKSFPVTTVKTDNNLNGIETIFVGIDPDFLSTYKIKLIEGRNFISEKSDSSKVILTRLAVEQLNLKDPIGQVIEIPAVRWGASVENLNVPFRAEVIGVVDNFHFESFRQAMMPLVFAYPNTPIQRIDYYTMRITTSDWDETLKKLQAVNTKIDPDNPLEYTFLNGKFEEFYRADVKRGQTFLVFSSVIVLIACLGLFALVSFSIEYRMKEIGVRKVLGATVRGIVTMVTKEFLILILIACAISVPIAYYLMKNWLEDFAYHIPLQTGVFALACILALVIAFITISFRTFRAAMANPVDSLRNE